MIGIGTEEHRFAPECGFQQIVSADWNQCPPDKCDRRLLIDQRQLTSSIQNNDLRSASFLTGTVIPRAAPSHRQASIADHGFDGLRSLDMAWSKQQSRRRIAFDD